MVQAFNDATTGRDSSTVRPCAFVCHRTHLLIQIGSLSESCASELAHHSPKQTHANCTITWEELYARDRNRGAGPPSSSGPTSVAWPREIQSDDVLQYLTGTEDKRNVNAQCGDRAGLSRAPPALVNHISPAFSNSRQLMSSFLFLQVNVARINTHLQSGHRHQADVVGDDGGDDEGSGGLHGTPPEDARKNQPTQRDEPEPSYPIIIHIPEYVPGVDEELTGRRSKGKKRKALGTPEDVDSRDVVRRHGPPEAYEAGPAQIMQGE